MSGKILSGKKIRLKIFFLLAAILVLIQFVPVEKTNPPILKEPNWDTNKTRNYAVRACFDCHSNETVWPGYASIAPISWFVIGHVKDGRKHLNFSEWNSKSSEEIIDELKAREMPLKSYLLLHPSSKLNDTELNEFIEGMKNTIEYSQDDYNLSPAD